ncbi:GvpL/GvpF family gas vesicle protein [Streptomyces sp. Da 82-17]|uniref:GvpL/GvpF family gas vesicle protein n=1 Tax=Streptomyces sp. Da 82-17 TaxID=3377116 RepID=UPI0038D3E9D4
MSATLVYAYAVALDADGTLERSVSGLRGVADAPVHLVSDGRGGRVVFAVSPVPEPDFRQDALHAHLEDLDWLESTARAHHAVIEALAARTTVLPLRLATVYLDDERVRELIDAGHESFAARLDALAAHLEWGVKIYVEAGAPAPTSAEAPADSGGDAPHDPELSPGRAYLSRRRAQRRDREHTYRAAEQVAARVEEAARGHAVDRVRHRPQQGQLARGPGENVVNNSYLVPRNDAEPFRTDVMRAADGVGGVRVEVTGPWAPYSFAAPADDEDAAVRRTAP